VTCGGDKTIRVWDIEQKKMIAGTQPMENDFRAVDWSSNGDFLIAGDMLGFIYMLDPKSLKVIERKDTSFTKRKKV